MSYRVDDLVTMKIAIVFESKDEAIECVRGIRNELGGRLRRDENGFYSSGEFYDRCVKEYGNKKFGEPAICLRGMNYYDEFGAQCVHIGFCSALYFRNLGYNCVYYRDIRDELFEIDNDIRPGNDIGMLLG